MLKEMPCQLYRGGTSKGPFFNRADLPENREDWEPIFLSLMGSPDPRQIDGLGGSFSTTSKIAVIEKGDSPDYDVKYTFVQVSVDKPKVSYAGNCGNMSGAVGPYAIENHLVEITDPVTCVRILNTNTNKIIYSYVPTPNGEITYDGDCRISGVPTPGARIELQFRSPAGSMTGRLLPTGHAKDTYEVLGIGPLEMSIVDASNPLVFVRAKDIGMKGTELPRDIANDQEMLDRLETIRGVAAVACGFVKDYRDSLQSPTVPKLTIVSEAQTYTTESGEEITADSISFTSRMMSMQKMHNSYAFTGALCTAVAAAVEGTIVSELVPAGTKEVIIGHAGGTLQTGVNMEPGTEHDTEPVILNAYGIRTARKLMTGSVFYRG